MNTVVKSIAAITQRLIRNEQEPDVAPPKPSPLGGRGRSAHRVET